MIDAQMLTPQLADFAHPAAVGDRPIEQLAEVDGIRLFCHEVDEWIVVPDAPIREQLKPATDPVCGMEHLRVSRFLQQREGLGVDRFRLDQIRVAERAGAYVPFALRVAPEDWAAFVVSRRSLGIILDPDVIEALGTRLKRDFDDGALPIKE